MRSRNRCAGAALTAAVAIAAVAATLPAAARGQEPPPSAPGAPAAAGAPVADPGIVEIPFDLAARTFKQVLPFDLPFHLVGTVPAGVARIELQMIASRQPIAATKVPSPCGPAQIVVPGKRWEPDPPATWTFSPLLDQAAPVKFILTVPALEAQRYYLFKVRILSTVTPDKAAAISHLARSLFDRTLAPVPRDTSLRISDTEQIRTDLVADVKSALGADQIIARATIFDPCLGELEPAKAAGLRRAFRDRLQPIVDAQNGAYDDLTVLNDSRQALQQALDQIVADSPLQSLLDRLELAAKSDPAISLFVLRDGGADLAAARLSSAVEAALAGPSLPPPGSSIAVVAGFDLTSLNRTYAATADRLNRLADWLGELARPSGTAPTGLQHLLTAADRQAVAQLLGGAVARAQGAAARLQDFSTQLQDQLTQRDAALDALARQISSRAVDEVTADASTTGNANTFQHYFITADLGLLYSWGVSKLVPYAGTNIYFRPVNPDVPLSQKGGFGRRFSVTLGYTLQGIADTNEVTRKDLFGGGSLVVGAGLRLTESIRLAAGALVFIKESSNPLVTDERVSATPYLSLSFDWKIAKTFAVIGQKLFSSAP